MREALAWLALGVLALCVCWWWYAVNYFVLPFFPEHMEHPYERNIPA